MQTFLYARTRSNKRDGKKNFMYGLAHDDSLILLELSKAHTVSDTFAPGLDCVPTSISKSAISKET
jgi:hypothetical protein